MGVYNFIGVVKIVLSATLIFATIQSTPILVRERRDVDYIIEESANAEYNFLDLAFALIERRITEYKQVKRIISKIIDS